MIEQEYIRARVSIEDRGYPSPCWIWKLAAFNNGYGRLFRKLGEVRAHRVSYRAFHGDIPNHLEIDHLCREKRCCNPEHLEAVTHSENVTRANRARGPKTHCIHGHQRSEKLIRGYIRCLVCQAIYQERWKAKRKLALKAAA